MKYFTALPKVEKLAAILFDPIATCMGSPEATKAGTLISPPPPAIASIKDAAKQATDKNKNVCKLNSLKKNQTSNNSSPFQNLIYFFPIFLAL